MAWAKRGDRSVEPLKSGSSQKLTPALEVQLLNAYRQQTPADFDLKLGPWSSKKLSEASVDIVALAKRGDRSVEPLKSGSSHKLTPALEVQILNAYRQQTPADFDLKLGPWSSKKLSEASVNIGKKLSKKPTQKLIRRHESQQRRNATLQPLASIELGSLRAALKLNPALDVEDWARKHSIIPYHATACVTQGRLNAYGRARLEGKMTFRHLNDEDVKALKAYLDNHDPDIEGWAIDHGIVLHEITACVAEDGKLNNLGEARWKLATKRTAPGARVKFLIDPSTLGPQEYQTLRIEAIKRLNLGLLPIAVANELGIPEPTVSEWRKQLHGEAAVGNRLMSPEQETEFKAALKERNPAH